MKFWITRSSMTSAASLGTSGSVGMPPPSPSAEHQTKHLEGLKSAPGAAHRVALRTSSDDRGVWYSTASLVTL